jgi:hypothetical protein
MFPTFEIVQNKFSLTFDNLVRDKISKSKKANQPLLSIIRDILGFCKVRLICCMISYWSGSNSKFLARSCLWSKLRFSWKIWRC